MTGKPLNPSCKKRWTYPRKGHGPLAVFTSLSSAQVFCAQHGYYIVYKCKYTVSAHTEQWNSYGVLYERDMPEGKALADKVMLLKKAR